MSIPSISGRWSVAPQPAKIGRGNTPNVLDYDWYEIYTPRTQIGTVQDQQVVPLEMGGRIVPKGAYKQAQFYAGQVDILPRIKNVFGYLLRATMGYATSTPDVDSNGDAAVGVNTHKFTFDPTSEFKLPWLASRVHYPGNSPEKDFGEIGFDCKVSQLMFTVPQKGKIATRLTMTGRSSIFDNAPTGWAYVNTAESTELIPESGRGSAIIGGVEYPILGLTVEINNNLTTPDQEMIVGDFNPDDFVPLTRSATVRIVYKYENSDLYQKLMTGDANGTEWNSLPFVQSGANALDFTFETPEEISAGHPYRIRIKASKVVWAVDGPIELQAGNIMTQSFTGTILEPTAGSDYLAVYLENDTANYNWPTAVGATAPVLTLVATANYDGTADILLDATGTLTDADSTDFSGGSVIVTMSGDVDTDEDFLTLGAGAAGALFSGLDVIVGATTIGTVPSVPSAGENLIIYLNASATPTLIQTLIQALTYGTISDAERVGDELDIKVQITDGDGGIVSDTIVLTHVTP